MTRLTLNELNIKNLILDFATIKKVIVSINESQEIMRTSPLLQHVTLKSEKHFNSKKLMSYKLIYNQLIEWGLNSMN